MKVWKKLSLVLCLSLAFSGVGTACDLLNGGNSSESSSSRQESSSGSLEETSSPDDSSSSAGDGKDEMLKFYRRMLEAMLETARSAKVDFALQTTTTAESTDGAGTLGAFMNYELTGKAIVSKTATGFDAKVEVRVPSETVKGETETKEFYSIGGYAYEYNASENVYEKYNESLYTLLDNLVHSTTEGQYTLETLLGAVGGGSIVGGEMPELSYGGIEDAFGENAQIEIEESWTGMKITVDGTKEADGLFAFLRKIDEDTTYGDLLDYPLSQISPELNTTKILDELYLMRNDTVSEAVAKLEKKSLDLTEKSLQENLNALLNDATVSEMIKSMFDEEVAAEILSFDVESFLKEESAVEKNGKLVKYGDLKMDDLAAEITGKLVELADELLEVGIDLSSLGFDPSDATFSMLLSVAEAMLKKSAFENLEEGSALYELLETARSIEVTKVDAIFEMNMQSTMIDTVSIVGNFKGESTTDGAKATVGGKASALFSEIRSYTVEIKLPDGATVVQVYSACEGCDEAKEDATYRKDAYGYYCDECYAALSQTAGGTV